MAKEKDWGQDSSCLNCGEPFYEPSKTIGICADCHDDPDFKYQSKASLFDWRNSIK